MIDQYGKTVKRIIFYDLDHLHAKVIVKTMEDGIKQVNLFREFLKAYTDDNPDIRRWVESNPSLKISKRTMAKRKAQQRRIEREKIVFNLEQHEVDAIFDILAEEMGD